MDVIGDRQCELGLQEARCTEVVQGLCGHADDGNARLDEASGNRESGDAIDLKSVTSSYRRFVTFWTTTAF
jgi:hypothetical protein